MSSERKRLGMIRDFMEGAELPSFDYIPDLDLHRIILGWHIDNFRESLRFFKGSINENWSCILDIRKPQEGGEASPLSYLHYSGQSRGGIAIEINYPLGTVKRTIVSSERSGYPELFFEFDQGDSVIFGPNGRLNIEREERVLKTIFSLG